MVAVKVGQVWRDKDKRRNTVIEILSLHRRGEGSIARAIIVGTEQEREYNLGRLQKRWEMVEEKSEPIIESEWGGSVQAPAPKNWQLKAVCRHNPDMKIRLTKKIADTYGLPLCHCHRQVMVFTEGR